MKKLTPKEKAIELANKFITKSIFDMTDDELKAEKIKAKKLTIICIDEIQGSRVLGNTQGCKDDPMSALRDYWDEVKEELSKL